MLEKNNTPGCLQQRMIASEIHDESYTRQRGRLKCHVNICMDVVFFCLGRIDDKHECACCMLDQLYI